jgi:hypothetical protein
MSTSATIVAALLAKRENTRLALATALVAANAEREALRAALSLARVELAAARNALTHLGEAADDARANEHEGVSADHVADVVRNVTWPEAPAPVAKPVANKWIGRPVQVVKRELPAHFAAAREAAMRMGRVVRVGA